MQMDLASDVPGLAPLLDSDVRNPWGIDFGPATPLWVNNQASNTITLYRGANGTDPFTKIPLVVTANSPTGMVFNPTGSFMINQGGVTAPARFLFNEFDFASPPPVGEISGWSPASAPPPPTTTVVRTHKPGAFYGGLALVPNWGPSGAALLAADSQNGTIDVYNTRFEKVMVGRHAFVDPMRTAPPYNVMYLGGRVYVAYAPPPGQPGVSALSVFTSHGRFIKRLATGGALAGPWGMAIAPKHWGEFGGALLVGNVDDGRINAFNPWSGRFLGTLRDRHGKPLVNPGLWGIKFGNGVIGTPQTLIFAAGIGKESHVFGAEVYQHGLIGLIKPMPEDDH